MVAMEQWQASMLSGSKKLLAVKVFINSSNHTKKKYLDVTEVFPSGIQGPRSQMSYMQAGKSCDRDYLKKVIAENGHAVIGVYGENKSFKDFKGGLLETCWYVSISLYNCFAACKLINITTILFKQQLWHGPFCFGCWIWN